MVEQHTHGPDGTVILLSEPEAAEVVEAVADVEATEAVADASVEVARIEAERDVAIAKEQTKQSGVYASEELAALQGEVRALREIVDALKPPEPEPAPEPPAPVVVEAPAEPAPDVAPPPEVDKRPAPKKKSGLGWF